MRRKLLLRYGLLMMVIGIVLLAAYYVVAESSPPPEPLRVTLDDLNTTMNQHLPILYGRLKAQNDALVRLQYVIIAMSVAFASSLGVVAIHFRQRVNAAVKRILRAEHDPRFNSLVESYIKSHHPDLVEEATLLGDQDG